MKRMTGRRLAGVVLVIALLSAICVTPVGAYHTDFPNEDKTIKEVYNQGFKDGLKDAASRKLNNLDKRLSQHHYSTEQKIAYTAGYIAGVKVIFWWTSWPW